MKVGIHVGQDGRFRDYMRTWIAVLEYNGIEAVALDSSDPAFWERVREVDLFLYRWAQYDHDRRIAHAVIPVVEHVLKIRCFPDTRTSWIFDDKVRQQLVFLQMGLPIVPGRVFFDKQKALDWTTTASYPQVFKLSSGAASENVVLVRDQRTAARLVERMFGSGIPTRGIPLAGNLARKEVAKRLRREAGEFLRRWSRRNEPDLNWSVHKNYAYFQEYLPGNRFDTRITVIGDRAFGFRRMVRDDDFRASGSGRLDWDPRGVDLGFVEEAFRTSAAMGFPCMTYDFLYAPDGRRYFCEASYSGLDAAIYRCPGHWDRKLEFHEGHLWPSYCVLSDLLRRPDLRQPELRP